MTHSTRYSALGVLAVALAAPAQGPPAVPVKVALPDQYERPHDLSEMAGGVVVLLYGDRQGLAANRELGEKLHLHFHPGSKGAVKAPVVPLPGAAPGQPAPEVHVVPVACIGKVPGPVRALIRAQIKRGSPDVPVWLDFEDVMKAQFGLAAGQPNLVVFDAAGRARYKMAGTLDGPHFAGLVQAVDGLRREAVGSGP